MFFSRESKKLFITLLKSILLIKQINMDGNRSGSNSPNKRQSFRSRTKLKDGPITAEPVLKSAGSYKMYLKEFPLGMAEDVVKIVESFEPIHNSYLDHLSNLKLYKNQLAQQFQHSWAEFMETLRSIIVKMIKRNDKLIEEREAKVVQLLSINSQKEQEIQKLKDKLENIEHLRQLEKAELAVANNQMEIANREMAEVYGILQGDMKKIFKYLADVEAAKQKQTKEEAARIYATLENFNTLLNSVETEQKDTTKTLGTMREMIKAMARSTKTTTGTQVDQSELQTKAANVFGGQNNGPKLEELPFDSVEASAVNSLAKGAKFDHVLDRMKIREKDHNHETYHPKKSAEKPWALTPTLLTFLQNMSKENQAGRVLPWQHIKTLIREIYQERVRSENDITSGMVGNAMLFDQFVVFYFIKKYKIRRLAEVKLLQFIISLRYYTKFWLKAETFAMLMDVMRFIPLADQTDMYNYKSDSYSQNFFFQVYRPMMNLDIVTEQDGTEYVSTKKVKRLMKPLLFFTDEISRSRLYVRLEKDIRLYDKVEHADFDYAMMLFMEEYYSMRRKMTSQITRHFAKINEKVSGYMSLDEVMDIFNEFSKMYAAGEEFPQKYPVQSTLHIAKLYMYAITSGKNDFQMVSAHFLQACQRYGFDSPYPFLHTCQKKRNKTGAIKSQVGDQFLKSAGKEEQKKTDQNKQKPNIQKYQLPPLPSETKMMNINQERIDIAAKLFSQHFSILKELKDYVDIFSKTLSTEKDPELLWKSFNQIKVVLDKGCVFLKYPLLTRPEAKPINKTQ